MRTSLLSCGDTTPHLREEPLPSKHLVTIFSNVTTNVDPVATFCRTPAQFLLHLAREDPIDLPLRIFVRIRYEVSIISTNNLPYRVIITRLLLQWVVAPQTEKWLAEQMRLFNLTSHWWSLRQVKGHTRREARPPPNLVPPTQFRVGVAPESNSTSREPMGESIQDTRPT